MHVVRDDHERVLALEVVEELLDRLCRDWVERRGRLVHEHDVRLDRDGAGDAEALLLAAREREAAGLQPVFHLIPERRLSQRPLDAVLQVVLHPENSQAPGDVVEDRLRERVRPLEDHPDRPPHRDGIDIFRRNVLPVVADRPRLTERRDEVVHPVQATDERALPAAGGTDDGCDEVLVDLHRDVLECRLRAIHRGQVLDIEDLLEPLARRQRLTLRLDAHGGLDRTRRRHGISPHFAHPARKILRRLRVASQRAVRLATRMNSNSTSAAAQARAWSAGSGDSDSSKIASGTENSA